MKRERIAILGAGSFGTALAHQLVKIHPDLVLWGRDPEVIQGIREKGRNPFYLESVKLNPFKAAEKLDEGIERSSLIILAIPCQFLRSVLERIKPLLSGGELFVNTAKGIEQGSLLLPSQIFAAVMEKDAADRFAALSGPTFALEFAQNHPTGAVAVSRDLATAKRVQELLSFKTFRLYSSDDLTGVELGGALKNVMAIATGIAEGLGFGLNTRAGLITRCLHEMTKLGVAMGANPLTFAGLSGIGDLILTATGDLSRNRHVGLELGRGKKLKDILSRMKSVAEGVATAKSVHRLAAGAGVEMHNAHTVYRIVYENLSPHQALEEILARDLKEEDGVKSLQLTGSR